MGRSIDIKPYVNDQKLQASKESVYKRKILISNIPENSTEKELKEIFGKFGSIERAYLGQQCSKTCKQSGFVVFKSPKSISFLKREGPIILKGVSLTISQVGKKKLSDLNGSKSHLGRNETSQKTKKNASSNQEKDTCSSFKNKNLSQKKGNPSFEEPQFAKLEGNRHSLTSFPKQPVLQDKRRVRYPHYYEHPQTTNTPPRDQHHYLGARDHHQVVETDFFRFLQLKFSANPKRLESIMVNHSHQNLRFNPKAMWY